MRMMRRVLYQSSGVFPLLLITGSFFSSKHAQGFFAEGFGMFNTGDIVETIFIDDGPRRDLLRSFSDFALGISIGEKWVTKNGFVAEIYGGLGRNLFNSRFGPEFVTRGGISLGYRF